MDIREILDKLDQMKETSTPLECQIFLLEKLSQAREEQNLVIQVALNNEIVGITRVTGDMKAAMGACNSVIKLMRQLALDDTPEFVVALINVATTYRLFGVLDESMKCFNLARELVDELNITEPYILALLYNNWGLLYVDRKEYRHAKEYLEKALCVLLDVPELAADKNITLESLSIVNKQLSLTQLERCKSFYETYGAPMINKKFPEYASRMAIGLVGEGSECFGYDDDYSRDHDFILGFCIWLSDEDYDAIGEELQHEYDLLIEEYGDSGQNLDHVNLRRGVFNSKDFYKSIMNCSNDFIGRLFGNEALNAEDWLSVEEEHIATVTNGEIFAAGDGSFVRAREKLLGYYPGKVWKRLLANQLHVFSQSGQYNYPRMMARGDYVTAKICIARALSAGMRILYLLNKEYAPYYKWRRKGLEALDNCKWALEILDKVAIAPVQVDAWDQGYNPYGINKNDEISCGLEELAGEILRLMNEMQLVDGENTFLDIYCNQIMD